MGAIGGNDSIMMSSIPFVSAGSFHPCHFSGSKSVGRLCIMSFPRNCGSFCTVQVLNIFNQVCLSVI